MIILCVHINFYDSYTGAAEKQVVMCSSCSSDTVISVLISIYKYSHLKMMRLKVRNCEGEVQVYVIL